MPFQGWKIHISCHHDNDVWTLKTALKVCLEHNTELKFASTPSNLANLLSKTCSRSSSGKFITVYPEPSQFDKVICALYYAFKGCKGPYILSDKPYKDSEVIFYRYGGFQVLEKVDVFGETKAQILSDEYLKVEDIRSPKYVKPKFIVDKEYEYSSHEKNEEFLSHNEPDLFEGFEFIGCIKHSNAGGVYIGKERKTGKEVLIKEARPYIGINSSDLTAIKILEKELRLMRLIEDMNLSPKPYDMYYAWKNYFLVQEFLPGSTLKNFSAENNPFLTLKCSSVALNNWLQNFKSISLNVIEMLEKIHNKGIIFGDLSSSNIMIENETLKARFIDFEGAYQIGVDPAVNILTPGFYSKGREKKKKPNYEDDIYALGCVIFSMLMPTTQMLSLNEQFSNHLIKHLEKDFLLPKQIREIITLLLSGKKESLVQSKTLLNSIHIGNMTKQKTEFLEVEHLKKYPQRIFEFCEAYLNTERMKYSLPLDSHRKYSLAMNFGELGTAFSWHITQGSIPPSLYQWLKSQADYGLDKLPPGLINGSAGSAWAFSELNLEQEARLAFRASSLHRNLYDSYSFGYGLAGVGMCALKLYIKLDDTYYLDLAKGYADYILEQSIQDANGYYYWPSKAKDSTDIGLLKGGAGIALFLLYLFSITQDDKYLNTGRSALKYDLSFKCKQDDFIGFPAVTGGNILYPYFECGSAGIAMVLLRYYKVTRERYFLDEFNSFKTSLTLKYCVSSGFNYGLAGIGYVLLDAYQILNDRIYLEGAYKVADGISIHEVPCSAGLSYPGTMWKHLSCDLSAGSAGIALFYHRLLNNTSNRFFTLDEILN